MRRALLVGVDAYTDAPLAGCVADVRRMHDLLAENADGSPNFECRSLVSEDVVVTRPILREAIEKLFDGEVAVALFFFAGHGIYNNLGGHLVTQDVRRHDEGMSMTTLLELASRSKAREVVVILDCCHSGAFGTLPLAGAANDNALLRMGTSVLTASRSTETASESVSGGLFTSLVCDALAGGAADVLGRVTAASIYAFVDQALGAWDQRPLFKAHVSQSCYIRHASPVVGATLLRTLPRYFRTPSDEMMLDPSFEPTAEPRDPSNEILFGELQKLRAASLVEPVGADHMYDAAIGSKACRLTAMGRHYWRLANSGKV